MTIDVFTATGSKKSSIELPASIFEAPLNRGLMHLALVRQQSNRRKAIAHVKHRGEVVGSTKKIYQQKHTGQARRGPIRSPLMKGGGKAFGPRNEANFTKGMPKKMRRAALLSCLSMQAKKGAILALESYPDDIKTKTLAALLKKLPLQHGRRILFVLPARHRAFELSSRNIPAIKTITASYLNPEDVLGSRNIVFFVDAIAEAEKIFSKEVDRSSKMGDEDETKDAKETAEPTVAAKKAKAPAKKKTPAVPKKKAA